MQNAGNLYKVTNSGCTTVSPTGPLNTSGSSTLDGCAYNYVPPSTAGPGIVPGYLFGDQGAIFNQPDCRTPIDAAAGNAPCLYASLNSPAGIVTAPTGSFDMAATGAASINASASGAGTKWLPLVSSTPPLPATPVWKGSDQPMPRAACTVNVAGQIAYYPF